MNLKKILDIYDIIKEVLPSTYPRPSLAFFQDEATLIKNTKIKGVKQNENLYAVVDPETMTINLPLKMKFTYTNAKGHEYRKVVQLNKMEDEEIAMTLLHEINHLRAGERYGYDHPKYFDEFACEEFAKRWVKKLKRGKYI
jgi:hypothetical protein